MDSMVRKKRLKSYSHLLNSMWVKLQFYKSLGQILHLINSRTHTKNSYRVQQGSHYSERTSIMHIWHYITRVVGFTLKHMQHKVLVSCDCRNSHVISRNKNAKSGNKLWEKKSCLRNRSRYMQEKKKSTYPAAFDDQKLLHQLKVYPH